MIPLILLFALFLPYILWPIETFLPYPHIIEELGKLVLIYFLLNETKDTTKRITVVLLIGAFFALTEAVFYLLNIALVGDINIFFLRLLVTIPFHSLTSLVILAPAFINKRLIIIGFILASFLHYFFNSYIASLN